MTDSRPTENFDRLQSAVASYLAWEADPQREPWEAFLERHAAVRDLLESMHETDDPTIRRLGGYELQQEIGRGGMGVVFAARDAALDRIVALKVLPDHVARDAATVARFRREAALAARLTHPGIVRVFGAGAEGDVHFIAMELIDGISLDEVLRRVRKADPQTRDERSIQRAVAAARSVPQDDSGTERARSWVEAIVEMFARLADALQHAHEHGIVHRDVKPANVLVRADGSVALADFGLAKQPGRPSLTMTGTFAGTPHYVAPEQVQQASRDSVGPAADVFSLGASLYEALTLQLPFDGDDPHEVFAKILGRDPIDPQRVDPRIAPDLAAIVLMALEKDLHRRYATAAEFADELRAFLDYRPVRARRPTAWVRLSRFVRRRPLVAGLGALAAAALLLGSTVAWFLWLDAREQRKQVQHKVDEFHLLANVEHLRRAREIEATLYPAWPERVPALTDFFERSWGPIETSLPRLVERRDQLATRLAASTEAGDARDAESLLLAMLSTLIDETRAFATEQVVGARSRLDWASRIHELSIERHRARWDAAIDALARSTPKVTLQPQIGLVPIGANPVTGLWEFYHLRSAADPEQIPIHAPNGHIDVGDDTGIVFVLVPGGRYTIGAQNRDENAPRYDPHAIHDDLPHDVVLAPYFIARHELTQGQWHRLAGSPSPSDTSIGRPDLLGGWITAAHPVEQVPWYACQELLTKFGLTLPTEVQWEAACRGGTDTIWWTGNDIASLAEGGAAANVRDADAIRAGAGWEIGESWLAYADGYCLHAPVDALRANPFGLHHVHGNVWEWCLDIGLAYSVPVRNGDGLRIAVEGEYARDRRIVRSGGYQDVGTAARSSMRDSLEPATQAATIGLRAARAIHGARD